MTPLASVAILEKFALLKIARCKVGAMSSLSCPCASGIAAAPPASPLAICVVATFAIRYPFEQYWNTRALAAPRLHKQIMITPMRLCFRSLPYIGRGLSINIGIRSAASSRSRVTEIGGCKQRGTVCILGSAGIDQHQDSLAFQDIGGRMSQRTSHRHGRTQTEEPHTLGMTAQRQIKSLGIEMNHALARDQNRVGVHDQGLRSQGAFAGFEPRDCAAHGSLLGAFGDQQTQPAQIDAGEFRQSSANGAVRQRRRHRAVRACGNLVDRAAPPGDHDLRLQQTFNWWLNRILTIDLSEL